MIDKTSNSAPRLNNNDFTGSSSKQEPTTPRGIVPERLAIFVCGGLIGAIAIPIFVIIQALTAVVWGTAIVFRLLNGKILVNEEDEL
jgi:hypothetical protein